MPIFLRCRSTKDGFRTRKCGTVFALTLSLLTRLLCERDLDVGNDQNCYTDSVSPGLCVFPCVFRLHLCRSGHGGVVVGRCLVLRLGLPLWKRTGLDRCLGKTTLQAPAENPKTDRKVSFTPKVFASCPQLGWPWCYRIFKQTVPRLFRTDFRPHRLRELGRLDSLGVLSRLLAPHRPTLLPVLLPVLLPRGCPVRTIELFPGFDSETKTRCLPELWCL